MRTILLLTALLFSGYSSAQNIVLDPGLEDTIKCPQTIGRFHHPNGPPNDYITHWRSPTLASPDLHHTCGYNQFQPRNGEGYAGIIFWDPAGTREYITALFSEPMIAGECYYVEFYVALNSGSTQAVDEVQAHFSTGVPFDLSWPPPIQMTTLTPHIEAASAPTSNDYQKISGFYTATGGEDAMTIGNFRDNANTTTTQVSSSGSVSAYYYVDDVTVSRLDIGNDVTLCTGDSVQITSNINCPTLTYAWSNGDQDSITYATQAGNLTLTVSGSSGCSVQSTINVTEQGGYAGEDTTGVFCLGGVANLTNFLVGADAGGTWTETSATPSGSFVAATGDFDANGLSEGDVYTFQYTIGTTPCADSALITLSLETCQIAIDSILLAVGVPNAFSPNGDNNNDILFVEGNGIETMEFIIFNRYGQDIFRSTNPSIGWDGTINGKPINQGVVAYTFRYTLIDGSVGTLKGNVTIVK